MSKIVALLFKYSVIELTQCQHNDKKKENRKTSNIQQIKSKTSGIKVQYFKCARRVPL